MGVCILGMGDCGSTSTNTVKETQTTINQTLTNMVNDTSISSNIQTINIQEANIKAGDIIGCEGVANINQDITSDQKVKLNINISSTKNLQDQVANALKAKVNNSTTQKQGFLTTASTSSNNYTSIDQYINNLVSTNITDSVRQSLDSLVKNYQKGKIVVGNIICTGRTGPSNIANISQHVISTQVVEVLFKALVKNDVKHTLDNKSETDVTNKVVQENSGLTGLVAELGKILNSILSTPFLIIGALILVVILLIVIFKFMFTGSSKSSAPVPKAVASFGKMLFGNKKIGRRY